MRVLLAAWGRVPPGLRAAPVLLWAAGIWVLSSLPGTGEPGPQWRSYLWNLGHAVLFGVLAVLLLFLRAPRPMAGRWPAASVLLASAYGVVDELRQGRVEGRTSSVGDMVVDALGALTAVLLVRAWLAGGWRPWAAAATGVAGCLLAAAVETLR